MNVTRQNLHALSDYMAWQDAPFGRHRFSLTQEVLKPAREWVSSFNAWRRAEESVIPEPCDVLLLHYSKVSQSRGYRDALVAELRSYGLTVTEIAIEKNREVVAGGKLFRPGWHWIHRYYVYAAYARWICEKYRPRAILTDKNGSVLAPFLREYVKPHGVLIHVAHSIPTENFRKFSMNDYDYYFVFGLSSLERLRMRNRLFGSSKVVLTGTYMRKEAVPLPEKADRVLLLGSGPSLEKTAEIKRVYRMLADVVKQLPQLRFIFKPHPRSSARAWGRFGSDQANVTICDPNTPVDHALRDVFVATGGFTNGAIDCALQKRPYILVGAAKVDPQLDIHRMTEICTAASELKAEILKIQASWTVYQERAYSFAEYHFRNGLDGYRVVAETVQGIVSGKTVEGYDLGRQSWTPKGLTG